MNNDIVPSLLEEIQKQFDEDLEKSLDTFKSFDGKPMYDEDREKIREFLRQRMEDRLKDK